MIYGRHIAAYNWWIFDFENLYSYNGYVFIKGDAGGTRIYVVDTCVPDKPNLVGYIDFPYEIKDMDFAHNCLYLSLGGSGYNEDSAIYRYDLAKILPERIASSLVSYPQPEEKQQPVLGGGNDTPKEASGTTDIVEPESSESSESSETPETPETSEEQQQSSGLTGSVQASGFIAPVPEETLSSVPKEAPLQEEVPVQQDQQQVAEQEIPEKKPDVPVEKPPVSDGGISPAGEIPGSEENDKGDQPTPVQPTPVQPSSIHPSYWPVPIPYWLVCNMLNMILPVPMPVKSSFFSLDSYYPVSFSISNSYGYLFPFTAFAAWPQDASEVNWHLLVLPFSFYAP